MNSEYVSCEGVVKMKLMKAAPSVRGYVQSLMHFSEANVLVDVFLRSYPLGSEMPKELRENTRCVRIIQVSENCLALGPKKPFVTMILPLEEVSAVVLSSELSRPDEDEIDRLIEAECPTWERDFASTIESRGVRQMRTNRGRDITELDEASFWNKAMSAKYAVVDIYAPWCQPCKEVAAILDEMADKFGDRVFFAKLDGDEHEKLIDDLNVTAYPTVLLIENGEVKQKIEGARSLKKYIREIEILLGFRKRGKIRNKIANGKVNVLSADTLVEYVEDSTASLILFYRKDDHECKLQIRAMRELAPKYKHRVLFAKADVKAEKELAELFEVKGTPELYLVMDGDVFGYAESRMTKSELRDAIEHLLEELN